MRELNAAVDVAQQDPATVAKQFLETHGLIAAAGLAAEPWPRLRAAAGAEAAGAADGVGQRRHLDDLRRRHGDDHELGDPVAGGDANGLRRSVLSSSTRSSPR